MSQETLRVTCGSQNSERVKKTKQNKNIINNDLSYAFFFCYSEPSISVLFHHHFLYYFGRVIAIGKFVIVFGRRNVFLRACVIPLLIVVVNKGG